MKLIFAALVILLSVCAFLLFPSGDPCDIQVYQSANSVIASFDALVDIIQSIDDFLNRLDICTEVPPTVAMTEIVYQILVELLSIIALATKCITQGRFSESFFA